MNEFSLQIYTAILQSDDAWDKKTRELKYQWVLAEAINLCFALFEAFSAKYRARVIHLCRLLTALPEESYQTILQDGVEVEYFADDDLANRFEGYTDTWQSYLTRIWYERMSPDLPTKEELLALGIRPNLVPAKDNQPSLF